MSAGASIANELLATSIGSEIQLIGEDFQKQKLLISINESSVTTHRFGPPDLVLAALALLPLEHGVPLLPGQRAVGGAPQVGAVVHVACKEQY